MRFCAFLMMSIVLLHQERSLEIVEPKNFTESIEVALNASYIYSARERQETSETVLKIMSRSSV